MSKYQIGDQFHDQYNDIEITGMTPKGEYIVQFTSAADKSFFEAIRSEGGLDWDITNGDLVPGPRPATQALQGATALPTGTVALTGHKYQVGDKFEFFNYRQFKLEIIRLLAGCSYAVKNERGELYTKSETDIDCSYRKMEEVISAPADTAAFKETNCTCAAADLFNYGCRCGHLTAKKAQ